MKRKMKSNEKQLKSNRNQWNICMFCTLESKTNFFAPAMWHGKSFNIKSKTALLSKITWYRIIM